MNPSRGKEGEEWNVCGRISYPYVRPQPLPTHRIDLGHKQNLSLNYSEHTCIQDDIIKAGHTWLQARHDMSINYKDGSL